MEGLKAQGHDTWTRVRPYLPYILAAVLLVLWLQAEIRAWMLRSQVARMRPVSVIVQAIDAETKDALPVAIETIGHDADWPKAFTVEALEQSRMRLTWIGIEPINVGVAAQGYLQQTLELGEHSPSTVAVQLRRPAQQ